MPAAKAAGIVVCGNSAISPSTSAMTNSMPSSRDFAWRFRISAPTNAAPDETRYRLIALAVETGDDHAIKFTDVCLREYALNPNPVYLAAARHAIGVLGAHG